MDSLPLQVKTTRAKSPNAPSYSLQDCLEDTRKVFRIENQVSTSRESIAEHITLAPQSGPFNRKLSSLRQYGLLEAIGKDLRVSDLFVRIEHASGETERCRALREALGRPTVFQRLLSQYEQTGLPSDMKSYKSAYNQTEIYEKKRRSRFSCILGLIPFRRLRYSSYPNRLFSPSASSRPCPR